MAYRALRWSLLALVALVALPLLTAVVVAWLEISINVAPWRDRIARAASEALGREVKLEGPLEFVPSLRPLLKVGGIRIANPPGFSSPEFASLGEARIWYNLGGVLRKHVQLKELSAQDVRVQLESTADGRVNWTFRRPAAAAPSDAQDRTARDLPDASEFSVDVRTIALRKLAVEFLNGATGKRHFFDLEELAAQAPEGEPVRVNLRGTVEKQFPYALSFTGGSANELLRPTAPWPVALDLDFLGTAARLNGTVSYTSAGPRLDLVFGLGTDDLAQIERLLQATLPKVGATALSGRVRWEGQRVSVSELRGVMGRTALEGHLEYAGSGGRPRITGALALPTLDMRPFLGVETDPSREEPRSLLDTYRELEQLTLSLRGLQMLDADLTLSVGRWLSLPGDVRDVQLALELKDGMLRAPVQATIAQVPLRGEVRADGAAEVPSVLLELRAQRTRLGGLAAVLANIQGVEGDLESFLFRIAARGENLAAIARSADLRIDIENAKLSYGNVEGGRPVSMRLASLAVSLPGGQPLSARVRGALLDEPFSAELKAGDLPTLARTLRSPITLTAQATGARFALEGELAAPEANAGVDLRFNLSARRAGDVGRWLGLSKDAAVPLLFKGRVRMESDEWRVRDLTFQLGRSSIGAELARVQIDSQPLIQARVDIHRMDVAELESMLERAPPKASKPAASRVALELPVLPQGIDLWDADLQVRVKRVALDAAAVEDAAFDGRIRAGKMDAAPFSATIAGTRFNGAVALDLRGAVPEASLWVAASEVDIGQLLRNLKIAQDVQARVEALRVQLVGRGSLLGEMLEKSTVDAELDRGTLILQDPAGKPLASVALASGRASARPGQAASLDLNGSIDEVPITIHIASGVMRDVIKAGSEVPLSLNAEAAGARLELAGKAKLPVTQREGELTLRVSGERFDTLNKLARVELPPWGPWSFGGRFVATQAGYEVPDLEVRVGDSRLVGRGRFTSSGVRPRVDVTLKAQRVQLDDFGLRGWSPFERKKADASEPSMSVEEMRAKAKEAAAKGQRLLSRETLLRVDAYVDVQVDEVLSGADRLGHGGLHMQLRNGRLEAGPAEVNIPGGTARLSAAYEPGERDVALSLDAQVDRFDYGILARRIKPGTDLEGLFSLLVDIDARAPALDAVMSRANGRIDFAVWPRNMRAGVFDLWAVNVFLAMVPAVDPAAESKVNCAAARFDVRDGKLSHEAILLDTSRMRVGGTGQVDFQTEALEFRLVPRAKNPQFFSLATPVKVSGTITDFEVGVAPGGVLETAARFLSSVVVAPLKKLTRKPLPRDGADVCDNAMRAGAR
jgi:uncharacterized protein involved in outer membrane biogenesis